MSVEHRYDVIVVGAGNAALTVALAAASHAHVPCPVYLSTGDFDDNLAQGGQEKNVIFQRSAHVRAGPRLG